MSDIKKAAADYLVGFACEDCGFSTKSGLAAQAHVDWEKEQDRLWGERDDKTAELGIQEAVNALNSYNPERDKLARELANSVLVIHGNCMADKWDRQLVTLSRQLLKLYEEEK